MALRLSTRMCAAVMTVVTKEVGGVFLIGINRSAQRNCVNHETAKRLVKAFENFNRSPQHRVAVLYGEGDDFCAGYDLKEVADGKHLNTDADFLSFIQKNRFMGPTNMTLEKPLIAAIEGYAVAGGLELACMADLRVAAEDATLGVFCRRVGVPLIDGGTVRLPRIIGLGRALDLILTGRPVKASEAERIGLINRIAPKGKALEEAIKLAQEILKHPQECMLTDRRSAFNSLQCSHANAMAFEYEKGTQILERSIQGAKKFADRKKSKI